MAVAVKVTFEAALVGVEVDDPPSEGPAVTDGAALKSQPSLLETSVELLPGSHEAPPVALESWTDK